MRRTALYSRSTRPAAGHQAAMAQAEAEDRARAELSAEPRIQEEIGPQPLRSGRRQLLFWKHPAALWGALAVMALLLALSWTQALQPKPVRQLTQKDIDRAVIHTMENNVLPSPAARAAGIIGPSVVRVLGTMEGKKGKKGAPPQESGHGIGTGVVIIDNGTILTNYHVVDGADRIDVTFWDGTESQAFVINAEPDKDLAVLRARTVPDDLQPATMRSSASLLPGEQVAAVGFPYGIGPSVSAGVVSGLKRGFRSPKGGQMLKDLIQFDAAANPGNSGGPLVTMDGHVVGVVTAILNPSEQRTFIGIGFAVPIENAAQAAGMPPF